MEGRIALGWDKNASEMLRACLRLLDQQTREDEQKLTPLRDLATEAFDALDRGEDTMLEGDERLVVFISGLGRRAVRDPGGR